MIAIARLSILASLLITVSALGEGDRVCMGGDVEQLSAAQLHVCQSQVQQVREAATQLRTPAWHFIVVCDESGWNDYAAFSNTPANVLAKADADTNFELRTTFFRGSRLNQQVAHEILTAEMTVIRRQGAPQQLALNR